jgi:inorganic pyrophosphatase
MTVEVVIEIPQGSQNKYEVDHKTGKIRLDRVLYSPMHYPAEYGLIEETLSEDGDPLDVLVLSTFPTFPGCVLRARVVGLLEMSDDKGVDNKLLAVAADDPRYDQVTGLEHVNPHVLKEIPHFFQTYKQLENKATEIRGWKGTEDALKVLEDARRRFREASATAADH